MTDQPVPDQPDDIESDSFDLPRAENAARRVGEFLEWWGDGLVNADEDHDDDQTHPAPLYSRDLQALINAWRAINDTNEMERATRAREAAGEAEKFKELQADLAAAHATLGYAEEWVGDLVEDYGVRRPESLAAGLDSVGEMFRLADWLHAEAVWKEQDLACQRDIWWEVQSRRVGAIIVERDRERSSRQAWAEEAMRLDVRLEEVRADRQRRIDAADHLRTALVDAFGYDQDPDEYPGDEVFIELLAKLSPPQCSVHPAPSSSVRSTLGGPQSDPGVLPEGGAHDE